LHGGVIRGESRRKTEQNRDSRSDKQTIHVALLEESLQWHRILISAQALELPGRCLKNVQGGAWFRRFVFLRAGIEARSERSGFFPRDLLADKKAPGDAAAFKAWLRGISQKVAEASMEGAFLGFGGVRVSDSEKATLAQISKSLGMAT
jgi:hypothetical protein